jgi:hypothetical protein
MNLDRLLREASARLRAQVETQTPPDLHRSRGLRFPFIAQVAVAAVVVIALVTLALNDTTEEPPTASSSTTTTPAPTTTVDDGETNPPTTPPPLAEWVVSYPPSWDRHDNDLVTTIDPADTSSLTLATFPIRVGSQTCPHMPAFALQDLGSQDALISVLFIRFESHSVELWPDAGFSESDFRVFDDPVDAESCPGLDDLEVWTGPTTQPSGVSMLVAFGSDVDDARRDEAWAIVQSLQPGAGAHDVNRGVCVATTPGPFSLTPPPPWKPQPSYPASAWWGTADLWTQLDVSGIYVPRKSVWWSENFTDAGSESQPDIGVSYERLDATGRPLVGGSPGTNASTPQDGLFMIAGIDPPEPGCYKVTAEYKGASLSYVYNHQPGDSPTSVTPTTVLRGAVPETGPLFGIETDEVLVFDDGCYSVVTVDPDARVRTTTEVEGQMCGDQPYRLLQVDNHLVVGWSSISSYSMPSGDSTLIAKATLAVPAVEPGRVWIVDWARGSNIGTGKPSAWQVDLEGNVLTEPTVIEGDDVWPAIGIPGGLALETPAGVTLWYPETGASAEPILEGSTFVMDTWGSLLAYCTNQQCTAVAITDLATMETTEVGVPGSTRTFHFGGGSGRFSPDGTVLALTTDLGDVLLVRVLHSGEAETVATGLNFGPLYLAWSPSGKALYAATYSYGESHLVIGRYDLQTSELAVTNLPFGGTIDFVVLPADNGARFLADHPIEF